MLEAKKKTQPKQVKTKQKRINYQELTPDGVVKTKTRGRLTPDEAAKGNAGTYARGASLGNAEKINWKHLIFINHYLTTNSIIEAARKIGVNAAVGKRIMKQLPVIKEMERIKDGLVNASIMSRNEVLERLTKLARGETQEATLRQIGKGEQTIDYKTVDGKTQLNALNTLAKHYGMLTEKVDITSNGQKFGMIIYMPDNGFGPKATAKEAEFREVTAETALTAINNNGMSIEFGIDDTDNCITELDQTTDDTKGVDYAKSIETGATNCAGKSSGTVEEKPCGNRHRGRNKVGTKNTGGNGA